jgi:DNA-binding MarR family transcriptional regulator
VETESDTSAGTEAVEELDPRRRLVELSVRFASAYLRWMESARPADGCDGLDFPRLRLLEQLHCQGPQMMRALADELGLTPRNMTALVDALEADGLARRVAHPSDRRATLVECTSAGEAAAEQTLEPKVAAVGELFDDLDPADQERLAELLATLLEGLRARGQRT